MEARSALPPRQINSKPEILFVGQKVWSPNTSEDSLSGWRLIIPRSNMSCE